MGSYKIATRRSFTCAGEIPEHYCSDLAWMERADANGVNFRLVFYTDRGSNPVEHRLRCSLILPGLILPSATARVNATLATEACCDVRYMLERNRGRLM